MFTVRENDAGWRLGSSEKKCF